MRTIDSWSEGWHIHGFADWYDQPDKPHCGEVKPVRELADEPQVGSEVIICPVCGRTLLSMEKASYYDPTLADLQSFDIFEDEHTTHE